MKVIRKLYSLFLLLPLLSLLSLGSCKDSAVSGKPVVTVSIEPQRWLLEQIVGDKMEVQSLLARGGNPESYEPAFSHLELLERSRAYFCVGNLGFETAILEKVRANNPDLPIVMTSDSIDIIYNTHKHHHYGNADHGTTHNEADPHTWSSAANAKIMAENMLRALTQLDTVNAAYYTARYVGLAQRIDSVDHAVRAILEPHRGEAFMVWHPSLSYFARDYGLRQIALGFEGKEFSVADTRAVIDSAAQLHASVLMVQKDFDRAKSDPIAKGSSMRVETINPLNYDWDQEMLHTARCIAGE
jgi:zinc transport system substrate-binding protein